MSTNKVTEHIGGYTDWRGDRLKELRALINETAPEFTEDFKWGVPVWTYNGMVCAISAFKDHVKLNFFKGVYLPDPHNVINGGLDSKEHRSINFSEADKINKAALAELVMAAKEFNEA